MKKIIKRLIGYFKCKRGLVIIALLTFISSINAFAAGSILDRLVKKGDFIETGQEVKNLSELDGAEIKLLPLYTPQKYMLRFECGGGAFSDGLRGKTVEVVYNDGSKIYNGDPANPQLVENNSYIPCPENPVREGYEFIAWYLQGNRPPAINPQPGDGEIVGAGCRYNIANDDAADLAGTYHGADGIPVVRALWRKNVVSSTGGGDGNGPDDISGGSGGAGGSGGEHNGAWDEQNRANQVIEYLPAYPDKSSYRRKFGNTRYSYRRLLLDAQTEHAVTYSWSVKKNGAVSFTPIESNSPQYKADMLTRADNGNIYRCEVGFGTNGTSLVYEIPLKVWYLSEIIDTEVYADGQRLQPAQVSGGTA